MLAPEPVSVVVTCYNLERYIGDAIESAIAQDYRGDVEIVVVDDCSTDRSLDIARRYPRVHVVPLAQNGGVLNATLAGIRLASHDTVMLLDGDDRWDATKISETVDAFAKDPHVALVTHDLRYIDGSGGPICQASRVENRFRNIADERCSDELIKGILYHRDYVWLGSALSIRKSRCEIDGFLKFCEALSDSQNTYQDWPLAFWVASIPGTRLAIIKKALFSYRVHGRNYSGDSTTIAKAIRNSRRSLNTSLAMQGIATSRNLDRAILRNAAALTQYYRFMLMCYSGSGIKAVIPFALSVPFIVRERSLSKELLRLLSFVLLSPRQAAGLMNAARDRFRALSWPAWSSHA